MTDDEIISHVTEIFLDWDYQDIKKTFKAGANVGAFILASCYIDHLSCFYSNRKSSETTYSEFVRKFMSSYDGKKLYKSLRCKLVHNYAIGEYLLVHEKPSLHLKKDSSSGLTFINFENFIEDINKAQIQYLKTLKKDEKVRATAIARFKSEGLLGQVDFPYSSLS
jgi:hypothetical protein